MENPIIGRVWKFGDDIDTDLIIPGKYLRTKDMQVFAAHAMEGIDSEFAKKVKPGRDYCSRQQFRLRLLKGTGTPRFKILRSSLHCCKIFCKDLFPKFN